MAVVSQALRLDRYGPSASANAFPLLGVGKRSRVLKQAPRPSLSHHKIRGMIRGQFFKQRHGIDKFALAVQFLRPAPSGIFLGSGLWCLGILSDATGWSSAE